MIDTSNKINLHQNIDSLFSQPGELAKSAEKIGNNLSKAESQYLNVVSNPNASAGEVAKAEMLYKRATQIFQSFLQLAASMFDIMRQALSRLSVR